MATNKTLFAKQLGQTLAHYRQQKGLTQEQVAEILDIGNEAVSRIERGVVMPRLGRLIEFADLYECRVADLMTQSSQRIPDEQHYIHHLLEPLSLEDRHLLIQILKQLSQRFRK